MILMMNHQKLLCLLLFLHFHRIPPLCPLLKSMLIQKEIRYSDHFRPSISCLSLSLTILFIFSFCYSLWVRVGRTSVAFAIAHLLKIRMIVIIYVRIITISDVIHLPPQHSTLKNRFLIILSISPLQSLAMISEWR